MYYMKLYSCHIDNIMIFWRRNIVSDAKSTFLTPIKNIIKYLFDSEISD